jgi:hypothetical protein
MATTFNWKDWLAQSENQRLVAQLGLAAAGAYGAKGDRDFAREQQVQSRGDSLLDRQRNSYVDRAANTNALSQNKLDDEFRGASSVAQMTNPFDYKRELQRDVNRSMALPKAAQMLGMPLSQLFKDMNTDDSILQRNANAIMGNEMNAQDMSPTRGARDISQLLGMSPMQSALQPQQAQLNSYAGNAQAGNAQARQGMMDNTNQAFDKYDASVADQIAGSKIDPKTGDPKKTSKWRSILGNVVKYGGAAAAIGLTGGAAAPWVIPAVATGSSFAGDKIAGKSTGQSLMGAAAAGIPGGTGSIGAGLVSGIKNPMMQQMAQLGMRAASENIPGVGPGLMLAGGLKNGTPQQMAPPTQGPQVNPAVFNPFPQKRNPWGNVQFPTGGR